MATQSEILCHVLSQNLCLDVQSREPGKEPYRNQALSA